MKMNALSHDFFRIVGDRQQRKLDDLSFERAWRQRREFDAGALTTQSAKRLVHRDPRQPGGQAGITAKLGEVRKRTHIGLLDDILCLAVIAQDSARQPVKSAVVGLDDGANRTFVAVQGATGKLDLDGSGRGLWGGGALHGSLVVPNPTPWMQQGGQGSREIGLNLLPD